VDFITFGEQELREVSAVLTGYAGDECFFHGEFREVGAMVAGGADKFGLHCPINSFTVSPLLLVHRVGCSYESKFRSKYA
jgi:hypothetical protein